MKRRKVKEIKYILVAILLIVTVIGIDIIRNNTSIAAEGTFVGQIEFKEVWDLYSVADQSDFQNAPVFCVEQTKATGETYDVYKTEINNDYLKNDVESKEDIVKKAWICSNYGDWDWNELMGIYYSYNDLENNVTGFKNAGDTKKKHMINRYKTAIYYAFSTRQLAIWYIENGEKWTTTKKDVNNMPAAAWYEFTDKNNVKHWRYKSPQHSGCRTYVDIYQDSETKEYNMDFYGRMSEDNEWCYITGYIGNPFKDMNDLLDGWDEEWEKIKKIVSSSDSRAYMTNKTRNYYSY